jgi:hypothetical protein
MVQNFESLMVDLSVICNEKCSDAKVVKIRHSLLQTYFIFRGFSIVPDFYVNSYLQSFILMLFMKYL